MLTLTHPADLSPTTGIGKAGTRFVGYGGVTMTVVRCHFGHADADAVVAGTVTPIEVTATSDGRQYHVGAWHNPDVDGPFADGGVYVERYDATGRAFHGWIDPVSRKLTQTG